MPHRFQIGESLLVEHLLSNIALSTLSNKNELLWLCITDYGYEYKTVACNLTTTFSEAKQEQKKQKNINIFQQKNKNKYS